MSAPLLLAIDAGGTAVKASLVDPQGNVAAETTAQVETHHWPDGRVERDPEAFWSATASAIRALLEEGGYAERVAAIGCTGFGNGVFLVDANGRSVRPGIVSVDHRAQPLVDELACNGEAGRLAVITGQKIWGGQTLMQLAGLARNEPEIWRKARWALSCKDFLRFQLSGEAITDFTDASGGGLTDLRAGVYGAQVFAALGIAEAADKLPRIANNSEIAGRVSAKAAEQTGLRAGTPIAGSMMDVAASVIGAGVTDDSSLVMIAGTWSINCIEGRAVDPAAPPILDMIHRDRAARLIAEGSPSSAANLTWWLEKGLGGRVSFAQANAMVAASSARAPRGYYLPFVHGPAPRRGAFLELSAHDDDAAMLRALFEGVAFQHKMHAQDALRHAGKDWPASIRLAGGAARSAPWAQIFADVAQVPVEVSSAQEVGALGAAICAAVAAGLHPDLTSATAAMTRVGRRYAPDPTLAELYARRFQRFRELDSGVLALLDAKYARAGT